MSTHYQGCDKSFSACFFFYLFALSVGLNCYLSLRRISDDALLVQLRTDLHLLGHRRLVAEEIDGLVAKRNQLEATVASLQYERQLARRP